MDESGFTSTYGGQGMDPVIGGALISAGGNLLSGALGNSKQVDPTTSAAYWQNRLDQREFAKKSIQWRVSDARKAGVHPLFALGANMGGFSPSAQIGGAEDDGMADALGRAGQDIGRAVAAQETHEDRLKRQAELKLLEAGAERDFAQASYFRAQEAKLLQPGTGPSDTVTGAYSGPGGLNIEKHPWYRDTVKIVPDEMTSRDKDVSGLTAGRRHPGFRNFEFPGGFQMELPATQGGGMPEEIDASLLPMVIGANLERHGWRWIIDFIGYATGRTPDSRRGRTVESWFRRNFVRDYGQPINPEVGW